MLIVVVHILNRGILRSNSDKIAYKLWKRRPENVKHFIVFGSKCYIKREDGRIGKFDSWVEKEIVFGYSSKSKAYKCFNMRLKRRVEGINVQIDETSVWNPKEERKDSAEQEGEEDLKEEVEEEEEQPEAEKEKDDPQNVHIPPKNPSQWVQENHPSEQIIGNKDVGVETRRKLHSPEQIHLALLPTVKPNSFEQANIDEHWIKYMEEEMD
jgi:hypothetical protein